MKIFLAQFILLRYGWRTLAWNTTGQNPLLYKLRASFTIQLQCFLSTPSRFLDDCQENVQENDLDNALGFTDLASGKYTLRTFKKILSVLILSE